MKDLQSWYREGLKARIDALLAALKGLRENRVDAVASIKRMARSFSSSSRSYGFPHITDAAERLERSSDQALPKEAERLIRVLQQTVEEGDTQKIAILLVDDDPEVALLVKSVLSAPTREVVVADCSAAAQDLLASREVALILLDLMLPDTDGRNLIVRLKENSATAGIPIFVLSAHSNPQVRMECLALGAEEFFEKPIDPEMLAALIMLKLQRYAESSRESRRDSLTDLPNRAAFKEAFERELSLAGRAGYPVTMALLDLDHFKEVNDQYGHSFGDQVLQAIAREMMLGLRKPDFMARWGGEEFIMFFPNTRIEGAVRALTKMQERVQDNVIEGPEGAIIQMTFSAGVFEVPHHSSLDDAVARADRFLYIAKAKGRNCVVASEEPPSPAVRRILLAEDDELTAALVKYLLNQEGLEVIHVTDGTEALAAALRNNLSLAILDIRLPGLDGFELLTRLRQNLSSAGLPVVVLTSMAEESAVARGFRTGADDYIVKPFSPVEFLLRVRRLIKSGR
ncbi:MAG: response regulator [Acidobacteria bacterium]|nr:response regulator [Acidobacteriota bacterium]